MRLPRLFTILSLALSLAACASSGTRVSGGKADVETCLRYGATPDWSCTRSDGTQYESTIDGMNGKRVILLFDEFMDLYKSCRKP